MCCADQGATGVVNGTCKDCGSETVDGESVDVCAYSPEECKTCGWQPCDMSC